MLFLVLLVALSCATRVEYEADSAVPSFWRLEDDKVSADLTLYLFVPLDEAVKDMAMDRATPGTKDFRNWLSRDELYERFLSFDSVEAVVRFASKSLLRSGGSLNVYGNIVRVESHTTIAAATLHTSFGRFRHQERGVRIVRATKSYSLPASIAAHVSFVGGMRQFASLRHAKKRILKKSLKRGALGITPKLIRETYGASQAANTNSSNLQSVAQFLGQHYRKTDLQEFFVLFSQHDIGKEPKIVGPDPGITGA